jgi:hypothetical protein
MKSSARLSAAFKRGAIRMRRHSLREPRVVAFQTAKVRRGVQIFPATGSIAPRAWNHWPEPTGEPPPHDQTERVRPCPGHQPIQ